MTWLINLIIRLMDTQIRRHQTRNLMTDENQIHSVDSWCNCRCCRQMDTRKEEICCINHDAKQRLTENITNYNNTLPFQCITEHPGFYYNCLVMEVLDENWKTYKQMYGKAAVEGTINRRRRHTAYRNLCRFIFGFVRKHNRVVLPACAVSKIRDTFPDDGHFTGFKNRKIASE